MVSSQSLVIFIIIAYYYYPAHQSLKATAELYRKGFSLHKDILFAVNLTAVDTTLATSTNQVVLAVCALKHAACDYRDAVLEFKQMYSIWEEKHSRSYEK